MITTNSMLVCMCMTIIIYSPEIHSLFERRGRPVVAPDSPPGGGGVTRPRDEQVDVRELIQRCYYSRRGPCTSIGLVCVYPQGFTTSYLQEQLHVYIIINIYSM